MQTEALISARLVGVHFRKPLSILAQLPPLTSEKTIDFNKLTESIPNFSERYNHDYRKTDSWGYSRAVHRTTNSQIRESNSTVRML